MGGEPQPALSPRPRIALFSLGGTIAMAEPAAGGGAVPALGPRALIQPLASLDALASVDLIAFAAEPSANLTLDRLDDLAQAIERAINEGADGIVITQGTDTIEESAFALDLLLDAAVPVVVTGAMRLPHHAGADGPANLMAAIRAAADPACAGFGVLVVMNDEIHAARYVRKAHSTRIDAFSSGPLGPLGWITEGRVRVALHPARAGVRLRYRGPAPIVPVVLIGMGSVATDIEAYVGAPIHGAVLAAAGGGHVPVAMVGALEALAARVPVVLTSRTGAGETLRNTYGYPGGEIDLIGRGLLPGGALPPSKTRIALQMLISTGEPRKQIASALARIGC